MAANQALPSLRLEVRFPIIPPKASTLLIYIPDDRFVAKEISRAELETMESFAPAYFDYISSAVSANVRNLKYLKVSHSF